MQAVGGSDDEGWDSEELQSAYDSDSNWGDAEREREMDLGARYEAAVPGTLSRKKISEARRQASHIQQRKRRERNRDRELAKQVRLHNSLHACDNSSILCVINRLRLPRWGTVLTSGKTNSGIVAIGGKADSKGFRSSP